MDVQNLKRILPFGWSSEAFAMPALSAAGNWWISTLPCARISPHLIRFTSFHPKLDLLCCANSIALVAVSPDLQFLVKSWNWCFSTYSLNSFFFQWWRTPVNSSWGTRCELSHVSHPRCRWIFSAISRCQSRVGRWLLREPKWLRNGL